MLFDLLKSSYFALFTIVALGFMLGRIKIKGVSLDVSAVIFIALLFGHFGVSIPKDLGNFGLVLFIFTIGIQAGPGFFDSFKSKGKTLIIITALLIASAALTAAQAGSAAATFSVEGALSTPYAIAYPAAPVGQVLFAENQTHVGNTSFGSGVSTMYAYGDSNGVQLNHLTGVLKIGVVGSATITKAQISTIDRAPIAGAFDFDFEKGEATDYWKRGNGSLVEPMFDGSTGRAASIVASAVIGWRSPAVIWVYMCDPMCLAHQKHEKSVCPSLRLLYAVRGT